MSTITPLVNCVAKKKKRLVKTRVIKNDVLRQCFFFRYSIDQMSEAFSLTLTAILCLDNVCEEVSVFNDLKVPIPLCYTDYSNIELPGDGTIQGFAAELGGAIGDAAVSVVVGKLGLVVSITELIIASQNLSSFNVTY